MHGLVGVRQRPDICDFLVLRMSLVTQQQLKARKALKDHNFLRSGLVQEPQVKVATDSMVIMTQVSL